MPKQPFLLSPYPRHRCCSFFVCALFIITPGPSPSFSGLYGSRLLAYPHWCSFLTVSVRSLNRGGDSYSLIHLATDQIPRTLLCIETIIAEYDAVPTMLATIYDTLVFLAISYRIVSYSNLEGASWRARSRSFFRGNGLYSLSKALLQSGQVYYMSVSCLLLWYNNLTISIVSLLACQLGALQVSL